MEINQLRYFVAVAREMSFSRAAERIHVAQSAISRQVKQLESELGVELLTRTPRGAELTEAGQRLFEKAEFLLDYVSTIKPSVAEAGGKPTGRVVLGMSPSLVPVLAADVSKTVEHELPLVTLEIVEGLSMFLCEWLDQSRIDVAVFTDSGPIPRIDRRRLVEEEIVYVSGPAGVGRTGYPITLQELSSLPLLLTPGFQLIVRPYLEAQGLTPSWEHNLDSILAVKSLVLCGECDSIMPFSFIAPEASRGLLSYRPIQPRINRRIVAATRSVSSPWPAIRALEEVVHRLLQGTATPTRIELGDS